MNDNAMRQNRMHRRFDGRRETGIANRHGSNVHRNENLIEIGIREPLSGSFDPQQAADLDRCIPAGGLDE